MKETQHIFKLFVAQSKIQTQRGKSCRMRGSQAPPAAKSHSYCNSSLAKLGLIKPGLAGRLQWPLRMRPHPSWPDGAGLGSGSSARTWLGRLGVRAAPGVPQAPVPCQDLSISTSQGEPEKQLGALLHPELGSDTDME